MFLLIAFVQNSLFFSAFSISSVSYSKRRIGSASVAFEKSTGKHKADGKYEEDGPSYPVSYYFAITLIKIRCTTMERHLQNFIIYLTVSPRGLPLSVQHRTHPFMQWEKCSFNPNHSLLGFSLFLYLSHA